MEPQKPYLCTQTEAKAVEFALKNLTATEPCSIIGMSGNTSKNLLTEAIYQKLTCGIPHPQVRVFNPITHADLANFPQIISPKEPLILILCLGLDEDCSPVLERLEVLRNTFKTNFTSLVIAHVGAVHSALARRQKILIRSMFVMKPLDFSDTTNFLKSFEDRLDLPLTLAQRREIYRFSGGNMGLIKSMFLAVKNHPDFKLTVTNLFSDESILYRLQSIVGDMTVEKISSLLAIKKTPLDKVFFTKYGYLKSNKVFTPLFKDFIEMSDLVPDTKFQYSLSNRELLIFQELKKTLSNFVTRDALAFILWGDNWEEKYSDWAIDQITHRLKIKLEHSHSPFSLETKKGFGLRLIRSH